jgi:hypothetical protein
MLGDVPALADLLDVLPDGAREAATAEVVRRITDQADRLTVLERVPGPWAGALADVVITALDAAVAGSTAGRFPADLCRLAGERLSPATAPHLDEFARRQPGYGPLSELAEVLRFRHDMLEELR